LLFSCSQESTSLDVFKKHKISYEGKKVLSSDQSFSLFIPTSWSSKHESYKLKNIKANVKTYSPTNADGFISIVSAEKVISFHGSKSLLEDFNVFLDLIDQNEWTLVGSGKTNLLNYPAYFLHYKTDVGTPSETESIVFILESEEDGVFYYLNASGSQSGSLEKELATMVQIISSFNVIKK
jgi:hypothetical protein